MLEERIRDLRPSVEETYALLFGNRQGNLFGNRQGNGNLHTKTQGN
jgi:hypothetical protein